jgi:hypothetical protein
MDFSQALRIANEKKFSFFVIQLQEIFSHPVPNVREAVVKSSYSSICIGRIKRQIKLCVVSIKMTLDIVTFNYLLKRTCVNGEEQRS